MSEFNPQAKLLAQSSAVEQFMLGRIHAPPVGVEISPTNDCNARCDWCFYVSGEYKQRHSKEEIDFRTIAPAIDQMAEMGVKSITWTGGGDPSVYSDIDPASVRVKDRGIRQGIFTNGYKELAFPSAYDWIRITVTEKYIISKHVAKYAKATKVGVNFNLCAENEPKLLTMLKQAQDAGVHYFQVRPALADRADLQKPVEMPKWLMDFDTPRCRIVLTEYKWEDYLKPHGYPTCHGHRVVPFIWHNGDVSTCAYHFGKPEYRLGNLYNASFRELWTGAERLGKVQAGIPVVHDCQHNCKLHEINKTLALIHGDVQPGEDPDFI